MTLKALLATALCLASVQVHPQMATPTPGAASAPAPETAASSTAPRLPARVRINITSNDRNAGGSIRIAGISICSAVGCTDAAAPSSISLSSTTDGQSTNIAEIDLPYSEVLSIQFKATAGQGLLQGSISLPSALKLNDEFRYGDILIVAQRRGTNVYPVAAASNYVQPEGTSFYYNPTFDSTVTLPRGVKLFIPAGAIAAPQIFVVGVHDTGDDFPIVDLFPVVNLAKPGHVELTRITRAAPVIRSDQSPPTPRPRPIHGTPGQATSLVPAGPVKLPISATGVLRFPRGPLTPGASGVTGPAIAATNFANVSVSSCLAVIANPDNQQAAVNTLTATGAVYVDWCTGVPPYIHMAGAMLSDSRVRFTIKHDDKQSTGSVLKLPLRRLSAWAAGTQIMINGFTWEGDQGTGGGQYGLANGYVSNLNYTGIGTRILGENRVGGGACDDFFYVTGSYCRPRSISAGNKLALVIPPNGPNTLWIEANWYGTVSSPLLNSYASSSTSIVKNGFCASDTTASSWSAVGTRPDGLAVFMSSTSGSTTSAAELCEVFKALGISNAVRLDGGPSAAITIDGILRNPLTGLYFIKYGSARYIPYALKTAYPGR